MEKQLLDTFLDLYTYDTKIQEWSFEKYENNPSRYYRLQMITALMKALDINCSYYDFKEGRFISKVQYNKWKDFKETIMDQLDAKAYARSLKEKLHPFDIQSIFRTFMEYRLFSEKVLGIFDGIYLAKDEFRAFASILNKSNSHLKEELKNIEQVLHFCINPNGLNYMQEELIKQFGYPEVDLGAIDIDNF
ncbi:hypothetical protein [Flavobacterium aciduliphilum]|uniref:Uncharacterized protein n=1 Tax=Flavobacterium aciduliphilum TaxID=1101402 RepID=A0A328YNL0_9FLAO|nr:hypothetical protein [Flavobacterium aciduliphilum]RAR73742.1 hypothetical protein CLV55_10361 [Flavobacterium aciduliphilum]